MKYSELLCDVLEKQKEITALEKIKAVFMEHYNVQYTGLETDRILGFLNREIFQLECDIINKIMGKVEKYDETDKTIFGYKAGE